MALERRTIELRVKQVSKQKAAVLATHLLKNNQEWVNTQQRRLQLQNQSDERYRKWLSWLLGVVGSSVNTWAFFILWALTAGALGWVGGLNTPQAVVCQTQESPCYRLRIWGVKRAIADIKPQCTKSSKGLMCLLPHQK